METLFKNSGGNWNKPTIRLQLPLRCGYQLDPNSVSFWFRKTCDDFFHPVVTTNFLPLKFNY